MQPPASGDAAHWQAAYHRAGPRAVSWYQREPVVSLRLLAAAGLTPSSSVVDVGGGASVLVDRLLALGVSDVTVLDVAASALSVSRDRLGQRGATVRCLTQDLLTWVPQRHYLWHDRAVFHFLNNLEDRDRYRQVLDAVLAPGGQVVIGAFAQDGPEYCSGLPVARYTPTALADQFAGFRVEQVDREDHHTPGGGRQPFTWLRLARHEWPDTVT